jgi:hypothetical protein
MPEPDLIELFAQPLNRLNIRYMVSGSVAAMLYGEPRVTHDIDFVVVLRLADVARLAETFVSPEFYIPPSEVIRAELLRDLRGHFNLIHMASGLKADFYLTGRDELHAWAFQLARSYPVGPVSITLAPPEYVVVRKLEYYREGSSEKHLRDIRAMLEVSGGQLDRPALEDWIRRRGLEAEWQRVLE